jgi:hypothetical protein
MRHQPGTAATHPDMLLTEDGAHRVDVLDQRALPGPTGDASQTSRHRGWQVTHAQFAAVFGQRSTNHQRMINPIRSVDPG